MSDITILRQRVIDGDEEALDELIDRIAQARKRADEEQKRADDEQRRADDEQRRADDEQRRADELQTRVTQLKYVYNLTNRCTLDYLRMRSAYLTC